MGILGHQSTAPAHSARASSYTLAAPITGQASGRRIQRRDEGRRKEGRREEEGRESAAAPAKINVIAIADLDFIGEQFFELRRRKIEDLEFDNVPFVLNCVDVLAGDESFVRLRRKRPVHRRLEALEARVKEFDKVLADKTKQAEDMATRRARPGPEGVSRSRSTPCSRTRSGTSGPRRFSLRIFSELRSGGSTSPSRPSKTRSSNEIREAKAESEQQHSRHSKRVRFAAAIIPPLPPLILGLCRLDQAPDARERGSQSEAAGV